MEELLRRTEELLRDMKERFALWRADHATWVSRAGACEKHLTDAYAKIASLETALKNLTGNQETILQQQAAMAAMKKHIRFMQEDLVRMARQRKYARCWAWILVIGLALSWLTHVFF